MLRESKKERRVFPLPPLSRGTGQVPTSMYFTVWLGGHRECWPVMHGVMSLRPCPHSLPCQANDDDDDNKNEEEEKKKRTLRTWLTLSWYSLLQRSLLV